MSFKSYTKWWIKTKAETEKLWQLDQAAIQKAKATKKRNIAFNLVSGLYARYATLVQEIDACLDQMCQPQKRMTVRKIMDAAAARLHELKDELQMIELHEYHYIDGAMIELKLIPYEVEILYPAMFIHRPIEIQDMWEKIQKGEKIYIPPPPPPPEVQPEETELKEGEQPAKAAAPDEKGDAKPDETPPPSEEASKKKEKKKKRPKKFIPLEPTLSPEEIEAFKKRQIITNAVKMIQIHERARQARVYFFQVNKLHVEKKQQQETTTGKPKKVEEPDPKLLNNAATAIEKVWRGYLSRETLRRREEERRLLIGMTEPSWKSKEVFEKFQRNLEQRRALRDQRIREYIQANLDEKVRVLRVIAPGLMEDIGDEIRAWFRHWYDVARNFDKFPDEEKGGSILVIKYETITPEQWLLDVEKKKREAKKKKADKAKLAAEKAKKKKEEAERKKKEKEKKKKEAAAAKKRRGKDFEYKLATSPALQQFQEGFKEHKKIWDERDDMLNPLETHYMDIITDEKCYEMQMEVRPKVDELMRLELEMLEDALEKDKLRMKGKKGKPKKKKKKPKKKKKKGKKKKDPTGNRKIEDLFQELVDNGIIRTYPETHLHEYKGDFSYSNYEKRMLEFDPPATLGDLRHAVVMNCILPMGVSKLVKPKSVLIAGPRQSGKHLLANAIFTETKSVLFDLSPPILAGKYPGKQGMKMLLHLINKMSRLLQPSIIFFDGAECPFYKKVPKPEKALEPKRLGKKIFKGIIKPLLPEDRVLVLGITGKPWTARAKPLQKAFERILLIPRPDYGSIYLYWREMLMPYHGVDRNFECSTITTVSKYYPLPEIKKAVEKVMVPRRIIQLAYKPLTHAELYDAILAGTGPITDKEFNKFIKWFKKTPLAKERGKILEIAEKIREAEAKRAEKEAQKKK